MIGGDDTADDLECDNVVRSNEWMNEWTNGNVGSLRSKIDYEDDDDRDESLYFASSKQQTPCKPPMKLSSVKAFKKQILLLTAKLCI